MNIGYIVPCGSHYGVADYIQEMTKQLSPLGNIFVVVIVLLSLVLHDINRIAIQTVINNRFIVHYFKL